MSERISSVIETITKENKVSRNTGKPFTIWKAVLEDGKTLNLGFRKPGYEEGDNFSGEVELNKFGEYEVVGKSGGKTPSTTSSGGGAGAAAPNRWQDRTFPVKMDSPEQSIIRQNALAHATKLVADTCDMAERAMDYHTHLDSLSDEIIKIAYKLSKFSSGQMDAEILKKMDK